ncbi:MAG TPA: methyltransferase domain-containing protein [Sphingomonas sp.]|nr:methyltransferase domain-containing protein [Sphingomonas sp.]
MAGMSPAALAFDSVAGEFDARFGTWSSVAAQRRAVRAALAAAFPIGARLIEIGGGTGEDACWLAERGRDVTLTDAAPAMVARAAAKLASFSSARTAILPAEAIGRLAEGGAAPFAGAYSNFAALNCVTDLAPVAHGLARVLQPGAAALLVLFGTACPGEAIVEILRGRPGNALRRRARGDVPARLGGRTFTVRYHRAGDIRRAMAPWFTFERRLGIGVFVPPSAAEPWITRHPRLLTMFEALDRRMAEPFAALGDHVLYHFTRTGAAA